MEKLQTLVWILIGLGVFIWRMVQKARATTQQEQRKRPGTTGKVPPLPASSFEELLKQMQTQNRPASQSVAPPVTPAGRSTPRETAPPARSTEHTETVARSLERPSTARSLEAPRREARLASSLPRTNTRHGQEDYWSRQPRPGRSPETRRTVADMLQNPTDVRAAFVLGEILQRRF